MSTANPLEQLRRRMQSHATPAAFAALAEEHRRAGRLVEAIAVCRDGLERYPAYVSARVTLGRALLDSGDVAQRRGRARTGRCAGARQPGRCSGARVGARRGRRGAAARSAAGTGRRASARRGGRGHRLDSARRDRAGPDDRSRSSAGVRSRPGLVDSRFAVVDPRGAGAGTWRRAGVASGGDPRVGVRRGRCHRGALSSRRGADDVSGAPALAGRGTGRHLAGARRARHAPSRRVSGTP